MYWIKIFYVRKKRKIGTERGKRKEETKENWKEAWKERGRLKKRQRKLQWDPIPSLPEKGVRERYRVLVMQHHHVHLSWWDDTRFKTRKCREWAHYFYCCAWSRYWSRLRVLWMFGNLWGWFQDGQWCREWACERWIHVNCISKTAIDECGKEKMFKLYGLVGITRVVILITFGYRILLCVINISIMQKCTWVIRQYINSTPAVAKISGGLLWLKYLRGDDKKA